MVLHDLAWPGRSVANIDHVVVGPPGVFVIDSKNWSGRITTVNGVLRQNGRARVQTTRNAYDAAQAVAALLTNVRPEHVVPVLCFMDGDVPDVVIDGVLVCSIVTVVHQLTFRPPVISEEDVRAVAGELRRCLPAATAPRPSSRSVAKPRAQKRRSPRTAVTALGGLALAVGLLTNPGVFTTVTNGIADLVSDQMAPPEDQPVQPEKKKDKGKQKKNRQNGQSQR